MTRPVRFQAPLFPAADEIERYFDLARTRRWFSNFGPCAEELTRRLADETGRACVLVANATLGMMAAIAALREPADPGRTDALVPSFAFAASAQCLAWNGLRPVFVDVDAGHWHLDPAALEAALVERRHSAAVVVALSSFGVPPPAEVRTQWEELCADHGVPLVVDSAAGYGAVADDGVPIGAQGDAEVVSFHALKPLSTGEGGAVFCRDDALAARVSSFVNFTFDDRHQVQSPLGLNAKMSELTAAVGLASHDGLGDTLSTRRAIANAILDRVPPAFARQAGWQRGTWQFIPVAAPDPETRVAVLAEASRRDIGLRTYYDPLHLMPGFASCETADSLAVTVDLGRRMISLPLAVDLGAEEVDSIASLLRDVAPSGREQAQRVNL